MKKRIHIIWTEQILVCVCVRSKWRGERNVCCEYSWRLIEEELVREENAWDVSMWELTLYEWKSDETRWKTKRVVEWKNTISKWEWYQWCMVYICYNLAVLAANCNNVCALPPVVAMILQSRLIRSIIAPAPVSPDSKQAEPNTDEAVSTHCFKPLWHAYFARAICWANAAEWLLIKVGSFRLWVMDCTNSWFCW